MRVLMTFAAMLATGCAVEQRGNNQESAFAVDARGAPGIVDARWTLQGLGRPIGVVVSAVRCAEFLFLSDHQGGIRRLNLDSGETLPTVAEDALLMSLAVDCPNGVVYGLGPRPPGPGRTRGNVLHGYAVQTGEPTRTWPIGTLIMPAVVGAIVAGQFVVGGLWMPMSGGDYLHPPASEFYRDKKVGMTVDLANGEWEAPFAPYELQCRGGGRCVGGSLWPLDVPGAERWLVAQPTSTSVRFLDADLRPLRSLEVSSPMFKNDGRAVDVTDAAASMHWAATNSVIWMAMPINAMLATVHSLVRLPPNYEFGQSVEFGCWLNLHSLEGRGLVSDIRLPGCPVGWDQQNLYTVDYGAGGRNSAPDAVSILRVPVSSGTGGFVRR